MCQEDGTFLLKRETIWSIKKLSLWPFPVYFFSNWQKSDVSHFTINHSLDTKFNYHAKYPHQKTLALIRSNTKCLFRSWKTIIQLENHKKVVAFCLTSLRRNITVKKKNLSKIYWFYASLNLENWIDVIPHKMIYFFSRQLTTRMWLLKTPQKREKNWR